MGSAASINPQSSSSDEESEIIDSRRSSIHKQVPIDNNQSSVDQFNKSSSKVSKIDIRQAHPKVVTKVNVKRDESVESISKSSIHTNSQTTSSNEVATLIVTDAGMGDDEDDAKSPVSGRKDFSNISHSWRSSKKDFQVDKDSLLATSKALNSARSNKSENQFIDNDVSIRRKSAILNDSKANHEEYDYMKPAEILFQYIPYYGQGDSSNDSIVRATLTSLSISDIDSKDADGNTLLLLACQYRCEDLVRIMINKGANCNSINSLGVCCLHYACYKETANLNIVKLLLQAGANPELKEHSYGCTPLHYAAGNGDLEITKLLIAYGAQVSIRDSSNYSCIDYANQAGEPSLVEYLSQILEKTQSRFSTVEATTFEFQSDEWFGYVDLNSNSVYYINSITNESIWEDDLRQRMTKGGNSLVHEKQVHSSPPPVNASPDSKEKTLRSMVSSTTMSSSNFLDSKMKSVALFDDPKSILEKERIESLESELVNVKLRYEVQIQEDKKNLHQIMSENTGLQAQWKAENQMLQLSIDELREEILDLNGKLTESQNKLIQATELHNQASENLRTDNEALTKLVEQLQTEINHRQDREVSLEDLLRIQTNLNSEREASSVNDEREKMLMQKCQQLEEKYSSELKVVESRHDEAMKSLQLKFQERELSLKNKLDELKQYYESSSAKEVMKSQEVLTSKESEIADLNRQLIQERASFIKERTELMLQSDNFKQMSENMKKSHDSLHSEFKTLQLEITEARIMKSQFNQLFLDFQREQLARKKLHNEMEDLKGKIRVYVRIRPMSQSEKEKGCIEAVVRDSKQSVVVSGIGSPDNHKVFEFDSVFGGLSSSGNSQEDVFRDTKHLMVSVLDGYNVCIFAYGQTGAGKSYTMIGSADIATCLKDNQELEEHAGITPRAVNELFRLLKERENNITFSIEVQMFQLYRDSIEDLLSEKKKKKHDEPEVSLKITLAEHSPTGLVQVDGAVSKTAESVADVLRIFSLGSSHRTTAATKMNAESSRSHLICSLVIKMTSKLSGQQVIGKLTLVDLAGSERLDKSGAVGDNMKEAQSINKSLSALGDVIQALTAGQAHIPYRNHPLTMLMSDSIGGNSKTLMFVNTSPADYNVTESNNSLSFASRCKDISNSMVSPMAQQAQLAALKKELTRLKKTNTSSTKTLSRPI